MQKIICVNFGNNPDYKKGETWFYWAEEWTENFFQEQASTFATFE